MMAALREWLTSVTVVMLLIALVQTLVPKGTMRNITAFAGGVILLTVLIRPLPGTARITEAFRASEYTARLKEEQQLLEAHSMTALGDEVARLAAAAIEEKASALGIEVRAKVETAAEDGVPLPERVTLKGEYSEELAEWIQKELGIPTSAQIWKNT